VANVIEELIGVAPSLFQLNNLNIMRNIAHIYHSASNQVFCAMIFIVETLLFLDMIYAIFLIEFLF